MPLSCTNQKPDENPKPDRVKPEPDFQNWQKPDPNPTPTVQNPSPPDPDYSKPGPSLVITILFAKTTFYMYMRQKKGCQKQSKTHQIKV